MRTPTGFMFVATALLLSACGDRPAPHTAPAAQKPPGAEIRLRAPAPRALPTREQALRICQDYDGIDRSDCLDTVRQLYPLTAVADRRVPPANATRRPC